MSRTIGQEGEERWSTRRGERESGRGGRIYDGKSI